MTVHCLSARDLNVCLGGKQILESIDLDVQRGEFLVLVGHNGCGKTTLLHCLGRLRKPCSGSVSWHGVPIREIPTRRLARQLAILPQNPHAPMGMEVEALVRMGRSPYMEFGWKSDSHGNDVIQSCLQHMELTHLAHRKMGTLSGGERQRAWIAMAMAQDPEVLLLDEPTTFLDIAHQLQVLDMLQRWKHFGNRTVVAVLHDLNHALRYADRIALMHQGRIIAIKPAQQALDSAELKHAFGVDADMYVDNRQQKRFLLAYLSAQGTST